MVTRSSAERGAITRGSGNVFADLGFPDAEEHEAKANVVRQIAPLVDACGLETSARLTGLSQHGLARVLRGHFRDVPAARLTAALSALRNS